MKNVRVIFFLVVFSVIFVLGKQKLRNLKAERSSFPEKQKQGGK